MLGLIAISALSSAVNGAVLCSGGRSQAKLSFASSRFQDFFRGPHDRLSTCLRVEMLGLAKTHSSH